MIIARRFPVEVLGVHQAICLLLWLIHKNTVPTDAQHIHIIPRTHGIQVDRHAFDKYQHNDRNCRQAWDARSHR